MYYLAGLVCTKCSGWEQLTPSGHQVACLIYIYIYMNTHTQHTHCYENVTFIKWIESQIPNTDCPRTRTQRLNAWRTHISSVPEGQSTCIVWIRIADTLDKLHCTSTYTQCIYRARAHTHTYKNKLSVHFVCVRIFCHAFACGGKSVCKSCNEYCVIRFMHVY